MLSWCWYAAAVGGIRTRDLEACRIYSIGWLLKMENCADCRWESTHSLVKDEITQFKWMYLSWKRSLIVVVVVGVASWSWQTAAREVESEQVLCIAEAEAEFAGGGAVPARVQRDGTRLWPSPVLIGADRRRTSVHCVSWRYIDQSQWNEQTQEKTRRQGLMTYCTVLSSAVWVFEISSRIEQLLQYLIWFRTSTIIWNT